MIKILSITYLNGTAFVRKGRQVSLAALHAEGPPGRRLGVAFSGALVHGGIRWENLRLLLPSRLLLGLVHELKDNFANLSTHIGRTGRLDRL